MQGCFFVLFCFSRGKNIESLNLGFRITDPSKDMLNVKEIQALLTEKQSVPPPPPSTPSPAPICLNLNEKGRAALKNAGTHIPDFSFYFCT